MTDRKQQARATGSPSAAISERLARVETQLESLKDQMGQGFKTLHDCVDRVGESVEGMATKNDAVMHGDSARPGMIVRIDRLEQESERHRWLTRRIIGAVVTLAVGSGAAAWAALS